MFRVTHTASDINATDIQLITSTASPSVLYTGNIKTNFKTNHVDKERIKLDNVVVFSVSDGMNKTCIYKVIIVCCQQFLDSIGMFEEKECCYTQHFRFSFKLTIFFNNFMYHIPVNSAMIINFLKGCKECFECCLPCFTLLPANDQICYCCRYVLVG